MLPFKELHGWCQKRKNWSLWLNKYFCHWGGLLMLHADGQCTLVGREEFQTGRGNFMFNFFLSYLRIQIFISSRRNSKKYILFYRAKLFYNEHNSSSHWWWNSWHLLRVLGPQSSFSNMLMNIFFQICLSPWGMLWLIFFPIFRMFCSLSSGSNPTHPSRANSHSEVLPYTAPLAAMIRFLFLHHFYEFLPLHHFLYLYLLYRNIFNLYISLKWSLIECLVQGPDFIYFSWIK